MNSRVYEERLYYFDSIQYFYRYANIEQCVAKALFSSYYEEKDDMDDDHDDFAGIIEVLLVIVLF